MACMELTDADGQSNALRETWVLVMARDDRLRQEALDAARRTSPLHGPTPPQP